MEYDETDMEIGFNVTYLIDVLNVLGSEKVQIKLKDSNSSAIMSDSGRRIEPLRCNADAPVGKRRLPPMSIRQLSLTDFRNLRSTTLDFDSRLNLVSGAEWFRQDQSCSRPFIVLCQAHSFRTHQLKQCVSVMANRQFPAVFGRFEDFKAGLST